MSENNENEQEIPQNELNNEPLGTPLNPFRVSGGDVATTLLAATWNPVFRPPSPQTTPPDVIDAERSAVRALIDLGEFDDFARPSKKIRKIPIGFGRYGELSDVFAPIDRVRSNYSSAMNGQNLDPLGEMMDPGLEMAHMPEPEPDMPFMVHDLTEEPSREPSPVGFGMEDSRTDSESSDDE